MIVGVGQRAPHLAAQNLHLLKLPPQDLHRKVKNIPLQPFQAALLVKGSDLFPLLVLWPCPQGQLVMLDVERPRKACFFHPLGILALVGHQKGAADFLTSFGKNPVPDGVRMFWILDGDGAVVGGDADGEVGVLEPAARLEAAVGLAVEFGPVFDGADEEAEVNEVELVSGEGPVQGGVIKLETAVGGRPCWLYIFFGKYFGHETWDIA